MNTFYAQESPPSVSVATPGTNQDDTNVDTQLQIERSIAEQGHNAPTKGGLGTYGEHMECRLAVEQSLKESSSSYQGSGNSSPQSLAEEGNDRKPAAEAAAEAPRRSSTTASLPDSDKPARKKAKHAPSENDAPLVGTYSPTEEEISECNGNERNEKALHYWYECCNKYLEQLIDHKKEHFHTFVKQKSEIFIGGKKEKKTNALGVWAMIQRVRVGKLV